MYSAFRLLNYIKILSPHEKESGNFSVRGIWNPEKNCLWNPESWALQSRIQFKKILNPANHWNPVRGNPESTTWNPEFKVVSVFPYMRGEFYFNFCIKHSFWSMNLKVQRHNLDVLVQWRIKGRGWEVPVPPLSQGLDDRPRPPLPPSLIWRSGSASVVVYITSLLTIQVSLLSIRAYFCQGKCNLWLGISSLLFSCGFIRYI